MKIVNSVSDLPNVPAVYAMYGGRDQKHVAYVGIGGNLKQRVHQHLIRRDSSVATGTSAAGLNPDYVTEVTWWEHHQFEDRNYLIAAELVAFDVLDPALRSRGNIPKEALKIYRDEEFKAEMKRVFRGRPTGRLILLSLGDLIKRIEELERRIEKIEKK